MAQQVQLASGLGCPRAAGLAFGRPIVRGRLPRPLRATKDDGDGEDFVRSANQEKLKQADDAVKNAQRNVGNSFMSALDSSGLSKALGIASRKPKDPSPAVAAKSNPKAKDKGKDLGRSGQSKKWVEARKVLVDGGLTSVSGVEAREMLKREGGKAVLVDVRPAADYEDFHATGSVSAQFYRYPDSSDMFTLSMVRQIAYAAQGVQPVEKNKNFVADAKEAIGGAETVIVACASGGTMVETENFPLGQASRSLLGAADLISAGVIKGKAYHLKGGLNSWFKEGGEGEGKKDAWDDTSGRVPFVPGYSVEQDAEELK